MHAIQHQEVGRKYWQSLLNGSQITNLRTGTDPTKDSTTGGQLTDLMHVKIVIRAPQNHSSVTPATLFTALCACAIGRVTRSSDVVLGLVVSGKSMLPAGLQDAVGPCLNSIPVRVRLDDEETIERELTCVHDQRIKGLLFETSQCSDIVEHCTAWPKDIKDYGFLVQFQNIEENPVIQISGMNSRISFHSRPDPLDKEPVTIFARPLQGSWELDISASARYYTQSVIENVLKELLALIANA